MGSKFQRNLCKNLGEKKKTQRGFPHLRFLRKASVTEGGEKLDRLVVLLLFLLLPFAAGVLVRDEMLRSMALVCSSCNCSEPKALYRSAHCLTIECFDPNSRSCLEGVGWKIGDLLSSPKKVGGFCSSATIRHFKKDGDFNGSLKENCD